MAEKNTKPNNNQRAMILRRNMDPKNYVVLKETWDKLYLKDLRYDKVKIIHKRVSR